MKCPFCGAEIGDDSLFCGSCGKKIPSGKDKSPSKVLSKIVAIFVVCILLGGGWFAYDYIWGNKTALSNFESFVNLLDDINNVQKAKECGLDVIYKVSQEEEQFTETELVYGFEVKKGEPKEYMGFEIVPLSEHSVSLVYVEGTSCGASILFKDKEDSESFFQKAMDYGLYIYKVENSEEDSYYIPSEKLSDGSKRVETIDYDKDVAYIISKPEYSDGWYVIYIGKDF